ncbi:MAG TPA: endonuclease/exonuclease/phosphatase family protein [Gammaproteobacteria bacterium]
MTRDDSVIRALTWNVHGCVGRDGVYDPERVARVLEAEQPDIAALQEIDARTARAVAPDLFSYFGNLFSGWTWVAAHTIVAKDGHYGHLVMSRWPVESLGTEELTVGRFEPRAAIFGTVRSPRADIVVMSVHLGLWFFERRRQYRRLRARLNAISARPMVALGDFNDFPGRGMAERNLCPPFQPVPPLATYPSRLPLLPLDRIWYTEPLELVSSATLRDAGRVSDHLPILASFRLA